MLAGFHGCRLPLSPDSFLLLQLRQFSPAIRHYFMPCHFRHAAAFITPFSSAGLSSLLFISIIAFAISAPPLRRRHTLLYDYFAGAISRYAALFRRFLSH
jgi:hypothetical protein